MSQGQVHPFQIQLQQMSNKIAAMDGTIKQLAQRNTILEKTAAEAKIIAETLKNVRISPGGSSGSGGDFRASKSYAKGWGGAGYVSIDQIQGRFVPYDEFVEIPIADGVASVQQSALKISMEGPFVATARYAVFRSAVRYRVEFLNGTTATFNGRTNGRFRGVASNTDVNDAIRAFEQISQYQPSYLGGVYDSATPAIVPVANPAGINPSSSDPTNLLPNFPGTGRPIVVSPLSMSGGRSMTFDGTIAITPQGAQYKRQNIPVPSSLWTNGFNGPVELGCFDVLEPGEEVLVEVNPFHSNNPAYGNISSLVALNADYTYDPATGAAANDPMPVGNWPWLPGQFDGHEGINDETLVGDTSVDVDRVTRVFDGSIYIGYMGFRIIQAPGGLSAW